jgi:hypothetical protein
VPGGNAADAKSGADLGPHQGLGDRNSETEPGVASGKTADGRRENAAGEEKRAFIRRVRHWITPDPNLDEDNRFDFGQQELAAQLATDDPAKAAEILAEAREISERIVEGRTDGAERRAATLQSATAIASSFSLAGAGLLAADVHEHVWQAVIGLLLLWITVNLGLCGWRATQASSSVIHRWTAPRTQSILSRADQTLAEARIERSVEILRCAGWNARYARFKVTMLRRASRHLVRATLGIPVLVIAVLVYALTYSPTQTRHQRPSTAYVVRVQPRANRHPGHSSKHRHTRPRSERP